LLRSLDQTQILHFRCIAVRVRKDQHAGNALDSLKRKGALPLQFAPSVLPSCQEFSMPVFRLSQQAGRTFDLSFGLFNEPTDEPVFSLQQLGE
jgi:hypothetical protein